MSSDMVEGLFGKLAQEGWGSFEPDAESMQRDLRKVKDALAAEAEVVSDFIETPAGQKFLLWLLRATLFRPPGEFELHAKSAEEYAIAKARREGQNGIAFMILQAMQAKRGGPEITGGDIK